LTAGQAHESTAVLPLLQGADQTITDIEGDPVAWPVALAGDKGYRADWIDEALLELGIRPVVPSKEKVESSFKRNRTVCRALPSVFDSRVVFGDVR